uniref:Uncharacterized protein n=1 Tax=Timema tahoe TaxID=61484 RepID=A0A7R9FJY7_9NEOP|nr:unnamed protein product [Timema tahoe]
MEKNNPGMTYDKMARTLRPVSRELTHQQQEHAAYTSLLRTSLCSQPKLTCSVHKSTAGLFVLATKTNMQRTQVYCGPTLCSQPKLTCSVHKSTASLFVLATKTNMQWLAAHGTERTHELDSQGVFI